MKALEDAAKTMNTPVKVIGKVGGERLVIRHKSTTVIDLAVEDMADTWRKAIPGYLGETE